ncbi:DNA cytosine methyltransferase [Flavobacteriaceae bacterium]|nr:DNA cytosine methyltransferase [Flavobacteriaceae bacterium]
MKVVSFFSGSGGLDLGFEKSGFDIIWANEYDKTIWETYEKNHPKTILDRRSIVNVDSSEVPDCEGIIGGPPCQSWSEAGSLRGIEDKRGQLFYDFIRIIKDKKPKFFVAENVSGMLAPRHKEALSNIKKLFEDCGYNLSFKLLNSSDYGVPQDRLRVFFIGIRKDFDFKFEFPVPFDQKVSIKDSVWDLRNNVLPAREKNWTNGENCKIPNHEFLTGGFSSMFMSRNRVRSWDEQSFTIQAGGRHCPIHPQAPKMIKIEKNKQVFDPENESLYRRLSVREVARIQTYPDDFIFYYKSLLNGYKMIGNSVPVQLAYVLGSSIINQFDLYYKENLGSFKSKEPLNLSISNK